jgi:hypothetical protein
MWCYALLAPAVIFILTGVDRSYQTDLWHHLARGREICATGTIISHDVFTYTVAGQAFVDNNWLTQIAGWQIYRLGGMELVQAINSLLLATTVAILVGLGVRLGASPRVAAGVSLAMVVGLSQTLLIRPQTVSMLLFATLLLVLVTRRALWTAPLIVMLWANVHGGFPIGLVLIGCFVLAGHVKWWWGGLAAIATLANPYGWGVYAYVLNTSNRATTRVIQEWLRPDVFSFYGAFWLATIVSVLTLAILRRRELKAWMWIVVAAFVVISCTSVRMNIWWYLAAAPIAMALWPRSQREPAEPSALAIAFYSLIVLAMITCLPAMQSLNPVFTVRPTDRTEDRLAELVPQIPADARVFCRLEWGEYFGFALPWKHSVFMDGRIEIYGDQIWDEYRRISSAESDWQELLDRHGVNVLVLDTTYHAGLIDRMKNNAGWRLQASSGTGEIHVKTAVSAAESVSASIR